MCKGKLEFKIKRVKKVNFNLKGTIYYNRLSGYGNLGILLFICLFKKKKKG